MTRGFGERCGLSLWFFPSQLSCNSQVNVTTQPSSNCKQSGIVHANDPTQLVCECQSMGDVRATYDPSYSVANSNTNL